MQVLGIDLAQFCASIWYWVVLKPYSVQAFGIGRDLALFCAGFWYWAVLNPILCRHLVLGGTYPYSVQAFVILGGT